MWKIRTDYPRQMVQSPKGQRQAFHRRVLAGTPTLLKVLPKSVYSTFDSSFSTSGALWSVGHLAVLFNSTHGKQLLQKFRVDDGRIVTNELFWQPKHMDASIQKQRSSTLTVQSLFLTRVANTYPV